MVGLSEPMTGFFLHGEISVLNNAILVSRYYWQ